MFFSRGEKNGGVDFQCLMLYKCFTLAVISGR
jgi:hypothetical protein